MSKKNSSYHNALAQALRDFGIQVTPITENVVVGLDYNINQVEAFAQGRGMTGEAFIKSLEKNIKPVKDTEVADTNTYAMTDEKSEAKAEKAESEPKKEKTPAAKEPKKEKESAAKVEDKSSAPKADDKEKTDVKPDAKSE